MIHIFCHCITGKLKCNGITITITTFVRITVIPLLVINYSKALVVGAAATSAVAAVAVSMSLLDIVNGGGGGSGYDVVVGVAAATAACCCLSVRLSLFCSFVMALRNRRSFHASFDFPPPKN